MKWRWPPAWLLVLTGLLLNILAILITSQVLDDLVRQNAALQEQRTNHQRSIELAWNRIENLERKKEALLLVTSQQNLPEEVVNQLALQLESWTRTPVPDISPQTLDSIALIIEREQQYQRDTIDEYYLQNIGLMEQMLSNDRKLSRYKHIALFLQILGLALILARDLSRSGH